MLKTRFSLFALVVAVWTVTASGARAGEHEPLPLFPDFCELDTDFRWFEPLYCECPDLVHNEGVYFSYERANFAVMSAPRRSFGDGGIIMQSSILDSQNPLLVPPLEFPPVPTDVTNAIDVAHPNSEWGWGNRYEFGYTQGREGWGVSVMGNYEAIDYEQYGFNEFDFENDPDINPDRQPFTGQVAVMFRVPTNLLLGFVDEDLDGAADDVNVNGINGADGIPNDFDDLVLFLPSWNRLQISNRTLANGVELMRTHRTGDHYIQPSYFELLYGVRFLRVDNELRAQGEGGFLTESDWISEVENKMVGPQVGLRWNRSNGRWVIRGEGRFMASMNIRDANLHGYIGRDFNPSRVNNALYFNPTSFAQYNSDIQFTPLAEWRLDVLFRTTRKSSIRLGYTGMYASNIVYGSTMVEYTLPELTLRDLSDAGTQHFGTHGLTLGFEINR